MLNYILIRLIVFSYVFSVIFYSYREGYSQITKFVGILLLSFFLFRLLSKEKIYKYKTEWILISLWLLFAAFSITYAIDADIALQRFFTLLQVIPISFVLYYLILFEKLSIFTLYAIVISTIASSIVAYLDPINYSEMGRLKATFNNANLYGLLLVVSIIATTRLAMASINLIVWFICGFIVFFLIYMLIQTGSRKAIIVLFLSLLSITYFFVRENYSKRLGSVIFFIAAIFLAGLSAVTFLQKSEVFYRFDNLRKSFVSSDIRKAEGSDRGRFLLYITAFDSLIENPIGVGLDNFRLVNHGSGLMAKSIGTYGHSNYIEVVTGTGIIGLFVYYSFYLAITSRLISMRRVHWNMANNSALYDISVLFMIVLFLYDFAMVSYYEKLNWLIIAVLLSNTHYLTNLVNSKKN